MKRRRFLSCMGFSLAALAGTDRLSRRADRPNILFALADDWSWPYAGVAGDLVVRTPVFDRIAHEGVLFNHAFVTSPSCTPSRASILTGQYHWRLEESVNLWSTLQARYVSYPELLENAGYHVGFTRKGWGPGRHEPGGRKHNPAGEPFTDFAAFLKTRPAGAPFCFWFGSNDPHRPYENGIGVRSGMQMQDVNVPACLPDTKQVRSDLCDYLWEVQRFDREVGELLKTLEQIGELDNTLIIMSGDNGMPFPHCKSNLYDTGTHVPLAMRWGNAAVGGRVIEDFISFADVAPTLLQAAGIEPPVEMTGRSILPVLQSDKSGWLDKERDHVLTGKERHAWVRRGGLGYPCRAIRTREFLYIRNFAPDRWPAGDPVEDLNNDPPRIYGDIDDSPSKTWMMQHQQEAAVAPLFDLAFNKRPAEELYDLETDPAQLHNVADGPTYAQVKAMLASQLEAELTASGDPRMIGGAERFERYPYYGNVKK